MKDSEYTLEILGIYKSLPDDKKGEFMSRFTMQSKNPTAIFGWSVYTGLYGVDRFMMGQVGLGVLKLLTFGGFTIWYFIDLFTVASTTRHQNIILARGIASSI